MYCPVSQIVFVQSRELGGGGGRGREGAVVTIGLEGDEKGCGTGKMGGGGGEGGGGLEISICGTGAGCKGGLLEGGGGGEKIFGEGLGTIKSFGGEG